MDGYIAQRTVIAAEVITLLHIHCGNNRAGKNQFARLQGLAEGEHFIGEPCYSSGGISHNGGAGAGVDLTSIFLQVDSLKRKLRVAEVFTKVAGLIADDIGTVRGIVCNAV